MTGLLLWCFPSDWWSTGLCSTALALPPSFCQSHQAPQWRAVGRSLKDMVAASPQWTPLHALSRGRHLPQTAPVHSHVLELSSGRRSACTTETRSGRSSCEADEISLREWHHGCRPWEWLARNCHARDRNARQIRLYANGDGHAADLRLWLCVPESSRGAHRVT